MSANLQDPIFTDNAKAREWLEARVWPNGPVCSHCGVTSEHVTALHGKAHRPGVYQCNECRDQFTVTVGTVFERSKIPLSKWLAALFLLMASKKGVSARQVHRSLGISYKSTWFMMHRLREALRNGGLAPPMGGEGSVVEVDEAFVGRRRDVPKRQGYEDKHAVLTLVSRNTGEARSFHVDRADTKSIMPIVRANLAKEARAATDEAGQYARLHKDVAEHQVVHHGKEEYVRDEWHTDTNGGVWQDPARVRIH
jgi:transposase-like protein